ncbi:uncharacterized protein BO88DRAFT_429874 [Aspergillus vadensis CBS 113365]|uniref:Uncharacterized protein n=1 Tax=Aspergillus vadensis (strain CBS 113365 / IMI 142717 / IBT 24658) TaxID=1448311 RepID=A0A319BDL4_ASPVC|nr:hypothetical protein BO88DRAFT_429874 [Aspergillus vadensis CBS 113365]PYH64033.1 hypothetical protein BO88DRAFT_429874 [Aspergillus vadensis CBS 113365]
MDSNEKGHTRRQRRSSLSQQLQRVFHLDKHVNKERRRRSSDSIEARTIRTPRQEREGIQQTDEVGLGGSTSRSASLLRTHEDVGPRIAQGPAFPTFGDNELVKPSAHSISQGTLQLSDSSSLMDMPSGKHGSFSPATSINKATDRNERRATRRLEAERLELEKRFLDLEKSEQGHGTTQQQKESRRLTKKQPIRSSSRASSLSGDESRPSRRFSSLFSSSRRSSRSRSNSLSRSDGDYPTQLPADAERSQSGLHSGSHAAQPHIAVKMPNRFGAVISKELSVNSALTPYQPEPAPKRELMPANPISTESKTNESTRPDSRIIENNLSHEQGPVQDHTVAIDSNAHRVASRAPSLPVPTDLDRLSFAATLNLKSRESGNVRLSGHRRSLTVSSPELLNKRERHTRGSYKSTRIAQVAADGGKSSRISLSSTNLQAKSLRAAPNRTSTDRYLQRQYKSYVSSPLAEASAVDSRCNLSSNAREASNTMSLQASIEDKPIPVDSVKKTLDPKYKQTHPHDTRRLSGRDGDKGEGDLAQPHSIVENPQERSVVGYTWASQHLQSPLSKRIHTNQDGAHAVTCREPGIEKSDSRTHNTNGSLTDLDVYEAKHAGQDEHPESQGAPPRYRTQACQNLAQSLQDAPIMQRPEACHVSHESKLTQRRGSISSISASSEEPRSEDYNTADEACSSISLPQQDGIASVSFPPIDDTVPRTLDYIDDDVSLSVGSSTSELCNTPKGRMNGRVEQLKNLQTASPFRMLFVICCHCGHWHDLPSKMRAKLTSLSTSPVTKEHKLSTDKGEPRAVQECINSKIRKNSLSGQCIDLSSTMSPVSAARSQSPTTVQCCWCNHRMDRSCCQAWTTIIRMCERHH